MGGKHTGVYRRVASFESTKTYGEEEGSKTKVCGLAYHLSKSRRFKRMLIDKLMPPNL